jgi:hypothetical protein
MHGRFSQVLDTTTQTSGSTYTAETISALPLGRSFSSVVNLAPGVSNSGIDANNPSVGGSSGLENQYIIDGVNTTGAGYGASGSYSIVYGSLGTGINTDFISEVRIKSFDMDAESGGATGGMVNAVTKTGDNSLHAQVFAYFDIDSLQAKDKVPPRIDPTLRVTPSFDSRDRHEIGFTVSGPIIKDRLFYFIAFSLTTLVKFQTGTPLNKLYGLIDDDNSGGLAAGGRGSMGRTPNTLNFDLSGQYIWKLANKHQISKGPFGGPLYVWQTRSNLQVQPEPHGLPGRPNKIPSHPSSQLLDIAITSQVEVCL